MGAVARLIEWMRGLSRRAVAVLLAGASVLISRPTTNLLATVSEHVEFGFTLFFLYQSIAVEDLIGHYTSWLFLGYFMYAYLPELYLDFYAEAVEDRRFRALSTAVTVYFGLLWARALQIVPNEGAFALLPDVGAGLVSAMIVGILISTFAFSGYILVARSERIYEGASEHAEVVEKFSIDSDPEEEIQKIRALPRWPRRTVITVIQITSGAVYLLPCVFLGLAIATVSLFSPVPEGLVVVGVLVSHTSSGDLLWGYLPDRTSGDIEFQIADKVTESLQSHKGMVLVAYCCSGLGVAGIFFFLGLGTVVWGAGLILSDLMSLNWSGLSATDVGQVLAWVWIGGGIIISILVYGLYGLIYWFQQLKRLPLYVDFWEQYWRGEGQEPSQPSVSRPPGLFLPGDALLILFAGFAWFPRNEIWWPGIIGYGLAWPVIVGIVAWSVRVAYVGDPKPIDTEGRDVIIALILQLVTFYVWGSVLAQSVSDSSLSVRATTVALLVLVLGVLVYYPNVYRYSARMTGYSSYLINIYIGILGVLLLVLLETLFPVPLSVYGFFIILCISTFLFTYFHNSDTSRQE